jgi:pimeloyl-ACP methyl ester carboxylesterase
MPTVTRSLAASRRSSLCRSTVCGKAWSSVAGTSATLSCCGFTEDPACRTIPSRSGTRRSWRTFSWWDQRGAALSYGAHIPPETMTIEQFVQDTIAVTDYLRRRFEQERIYLLGHSWGSFIGLQAAARSPDRYEAYLGMAQVVHQLESEKLAYDYMLAAYKERGDAGMVRKLEATPVTMSGGTPAAYLKVRDAAMHQLGIGTTHDMTSVITGVFLESWRFRGYTLREKLNLWRGRAFSRRFGLWDELIRVDLRETCPSLQVPVHFFEGRYDYTCVTALARDYFEQLQAPAKGFHVFDHSAHSPLMEEPKKAHLILQQHVLDGPGPASEMSSTTHT